LTDVSEVRTASIIRAVMLEELRTSETSANSNATTRRYIPENSKLHLETVADQNSCISWCVFHCGLSTREIGVITGKEKDVDPGL
jgi:hypothetical protein